MNYLRHPAILLLIFAVIVIGLERSTGSPAVVPASAGEDVFSAERAFGVLSELLAEGQPHVVGSPLNRVVGNRIIRKLENLGYEPVVQEVFHCNSLFGHCADLRNIMVRYRGSAADHLDATGQKGTAVMLTAHYDSDWASPGAADDGAGVAAILEIARLLASRDPFANDIILLITDAEEQGLIGADAFAEQHPWFEDVGVVINLEARGVSGASVMFETGEGNRSIIRMLSKNVPRPVAESLYFEVYKRMPNDTDYSVYSARGVMGLNFAFVRGVPVYHSAIDDLERLDVGSLQHHGDNAWGMVQALGERDLKRLVSRENAGYIDVFGQKLIHYPEGVTGGLALFLGVWALLAAAIAYRKEFRFSQLAWAIVLIPVVLLLPPLSAWLLSFPLGHWVEIHPLDHPAPWPGRLAIYSGLLLSWYVGLKWVSGRVSPCAWTVLAWAVFGGLGLWLSANVPTASHIALLPLMAFAMGSLLDAVLRRPGAPLLFASVAGFAVTAYLSVYYFTVLDAIIGFDRSGLKAATFGLVTLTAMPLLLTWFREKEEPPSWRPAKYLAIMALVLCLVHGFMPTFTEDRPRPLALMHIENAGGDGKAMLGLDSLYGLVDRDFAEEQGFAFETLELGGREYSIPVRPTESLELPEIAVASSQVMNLEVEGRQRHELVLDLPAGLMMLQLNFDREASIDRVEVNGHLALDKSRKGKHERDIHWLQLMHPAQGPVVISFDADSAAGSHLYAVGRYPLPSAIVDSLADDWPADAQPNYLGHYAVRYQAIELGEQE